MRRLTPRWFLASSLAVSLAAPLPVQAASAASAQRDPWDGRLMPPEPVTDHVWVMRQPNRLWAAVIGNVTIIEQSDGVVLIDSGGSIADGRSIVEEVAKLTAKPIKAVAITHFHGDHPFGLPAIVGRFPNVRIISTPLTSDFIRTETKVGIGKVDAALNQARRERAIKSIADIRAEAAKPTVSADERGQLELEARWIEMRIEQLQENYAVLPTETFTDRLMLNDRKTPVELRFFGAGNTHGDLVAWLPKQKIVATGDIVVAPTPYGFTVSTKPWLKTLESLEQLPFTTIIPGHGAVQHDRRYLDALEWSMRDIAAKAATAAADPAMTKEKAVEAFDNRPHEARFGATDAWTKRWLNDYWLAGMVQTAFDEARGIPAPGK